jgi:hypothetical protein
MVIIIILFFQVVGVYSLPSIDMLTMSRRAPHHTILMEDIHTLEFFLDCEILKLLHQMKAGETLDINVVDQSKYHQASTREPSPTGRRL